MKGFIPATKKIQHTLGATGGGGAVVLHNYNYNINYFITLVNKFIEKNLYQVRLQPFSKSSPSARGGCGCRKV